MRRVGLHARHEEEAAGGDVLQLLSGTIEVDAQIAEGLAGKRGTCGEAGGVGQAGAGGKRGKGEEGAEAGSSQKIATSGHRWCFP